MPQPMPSNVGSLVPKIGGWPTVKVFDADAGRDLVLGHVVEGGREDAEQDDAERLQAANLQTCGGFWLHQWPAFAAFLISSHTVTQALSRAAFISASGLSGEITA